MIAPLNEWTKLGSRDRQSPDGRYRIRRTEVSGSIRYLAYFDHSDRISGWCRTPDEAYEAAVKYAEGNR